MQSRQQGQVIWWVLVITVVLSALGVQMLNTSLLQWQLVKRSHNIVQAFWQAETALLEMEQLLRSNGTGWLAAPSEQVLMPELPQLIDSSAWQLYQQRPLATGLTIGTRVVAIGPACLDQEVACERLLALTVVMFDADGFRLIALRMQLLAQQSEGGLIRFRRVSWEWL
jgi:hypothetical protein